MTTTISKPVRDQVFDIVGFVPTREQRVIIDSPIGLTWWLVVSRRARA